MPRKDEIAPGKRASTLSGDAIRRFFGRDGYQVADDAVRLIKDECQDAAGANPRASRARWEGIMGAAIEVVGNDGRHRVQKKDVETAATAFNAGVAHARDHFPTRAEVQEARQRRVARKRDRELFGE